MEKQKRYLISVKYSDSFYKRIYKSCKRIKSTKVYKYYLNQLNKGLCKEITTQIIKQ